MSRRAAFTLVELLVVIGIIALLVAMLLPALNRARTAAVKIQCAAQLRDLNLGILMYANANKGTLPWKNGGGVFAMLAGYQPWAYGGANEYGGVADVYYGNFIRDARLFRCPTLVNSSAVAAWWQGDALSALNNGYLGYQFRGCSFKGLNPGPGIPGRVHTYWINIAKLRSDHVIVHDNVVDDAWGRGFLEMNWTAHTRRGLPEGGNAARLDGSVIWLAFGKSLASPGPNWYSCWGWEYAPTNTVHLGDNHTHWGREDGSNDSAYARQYLWSGNHGTSSPLRGKLGVYP